MLRDREPSADGQLDFREDRESGGSRAGLRGF